MSAGVCSKLRPGAEEEGMPDDLLERLTKALARAPGVAAVALGGSRARGTAAPSSDFDIGLYYRRGAEPEASRLRDVLAPLVDDAAAATVTEIGEWGAWIVGGAWLSVGGQKVDILYRCVESVEELIRACSAGHVTMHYQPGYPHGFSSAIWMGEAALCKPLHDPDGALAALKAMALPYPDKLGRALVDRFLWEVSFSIENGELAVPRGDATHVAGCAYRALACAAQVLFALNRRYLVNEKGALDEAARFPLTIPNLEERVASTWRDVGSGALQESLRTLRALDRDLEAMTMGGGFGARDC
jgi:predicted nucleotidyltransferase